MTDTRRHDRHIEALHRWRIRRSFALIANLQAKGFSENDAIKVAITLHRMEPDRWCSIDATPDSAWSDR